MKQILRSNKKLSPKLKAAITLFIAVAVVAFIFSIKYSGNAKNDFPDLHFSEKLGQPECASPGGFYKEAFDIKLSSANPDHKIYYTTDGSEPTLASSLYSKPIIIANRTAARNYLSAIPTSPRWKPPIDEVFKGTILRAIAVDEKNNKSAELIRSFFVDEKERDRYSLPVISITVNQKDLFGYNKGIYVLGKSYTDKDNYIRKSIPLELPWWQYPSNYLLRGDNSERPGHIEFFAEKNVPGFEANIGIRINGNATRGFAQKSLRICFREKYGQPVLGYDLFPSNPVKRFNSFILRNSGNDWDKTMFRDAFMQSLMKNTHLDIQDDRPAIVFINGEYWGVHNIRERFDEHYLANKYALNADSVTILELSGKLVQGETEDEEKFKELLDFIKKNNLSVQENYDYVLSKIDVESFMDFLIANIYFCNSDWPNNNVKFWRAKPDLKSTDTTGVRDGRWRWMLYDTDWGFGYTGNDAIHLNLLEKAKKTSSIGVIFGGLMKNKSFSERFSARFHYHLEHTFKPELVIARIDEFKRIFAPEMQEHINRWRVIGSYSKWEKFVAELKEFALERPAIQIRQLDEFMKKQNSGK